MNILRIISISLLQNVRISRSGQGKGTLFRNIQKTGRCKDKRMIFLYAGAYLSLAYAEQRKPEFLY